MQENIYSDLWGETLYKKDIGSRVYLYDGGSGATRYRPSLILDNTLMVEKTIDFLKKALQEIKKEDGS